MINPDTKTINWFECKVQNVSGSVAEKLQTCGEKIENLDRHFETSCEWEISRLVEKNIQFVFEEDEQFEEKILGMIK